MSYPGLAVPEVSRAYARYDVRGT